MAEAKEEDQHVDTDQCPTNQNAPQNHVATNQMITPRRAFEMADGMLMQASTMRDCARSMQEQLDALLSTADFLEKQAYTLQAMGTENREKASQAMDGLLGRYNVIAPHYDAVYGGIVSKLSVDVEDGDVMTDYVEAIGDDLRLFVEDYAYEIRAAQFKSLNKTVPNTNDEDEKRREQSDRMESPRAELPKESPSKLPSSAVDSVTEFDRSDMSSSPCRTSNFQRKQHLWSRTSYKPTSQDKMYKKKVMVENMKKKQKIMATSVSSPRRLRTESTAGQTSPKI